MLENTAVLSSYSITSEIYLAILVCLLPLLSFFILSTSLLKPHTASWLSISLTALAVLSSIFLLYTAWNGASIMYKWQWFQIGTHPFVIGLYIDKVGASMLFIVTLISWLVQLYSTAYMKGDTGYRRYFANLGLFTFSMVGLVLSSNLMITFVFWELVGLSSYLLIGHWYQKQSAATAAKKAFIVNRIGDAGFVVGLAILWTRFGTLDLQQLAVYMGQSIIIGDEWVFASTGIAASWLTVAGIGLFMGAVGKSAQFPLQIWLPDAMEGPTPVSALIHAATMVAAGVYLMARVFILLNIDALTLMAVIGAVTAFMGAVAALAQHDIKKVLAYSTISQLGYMIMGLGVGAYSAAIFHLFTHAFFKAGLFLCAGAVIHALHQFADCSGNHFDVQDMRYMGGLRKYLPFTFITFTITGLSLAGLPLFSGFLSKDALLTGAYAWADHMTEGSLSWYYVVPYLGFLTVVLTALYVVRQLLLVFFGDFRFLKIFPAGEHKVEEPPVVMRAVLITLAVLSFGFVWSVNPLTVEGSWLYREIVTPEIVSPDFNAVWQANLEVLVLQKHMIVSIVSVVSILIGAAIAWYIYRPTGTYVARYLQRPPDKGNIWQKLSWHNWYLNQLYNTIISQSVLVIGGWLRFLDRRIIDKLIELIAIVHVILAHIIRWVDRAVVDGFVNFSVFFAGRVGVLSRSLQGGRVQSYILLAVLALLLMVFFIL